MQSKEEEKQCTSFKRSYRCRVSKLHCLCHSKPHSFKLSNDALSTQKKFFLIVDVGAIDRRQGWNYWKSVRGAGPLLIIKRRILLSNAFAYSCVGLSILGNVLLFLYCCSWRQHIRNLVEYEQNCTSYFLSTPFD